VVTRQGPRLTEALCGTAIAQLAGSALGQPLDPRVTAWRTRPLTATPDPCLWVDALGLRSWEGGHVRPRAGFGGMGVKAAGQRAIRGDRSHGLSGPQNLRAPRGGLGVSDQRAGLVRACRREFQGTTWERCPTPFRRNVLDACPQALHDRVHAAWRAVVDAPDRRPADCQHTAPQAVAIGEAGGADALAIVAYPPEVWRRWRTPNDLERVNREIQRRERVIRIFPHRASAECLLGAVRLELQDGGRTSRR